MVICLEQGTDLHMAQLMPLLLTVSCFSKIQICFIFLVPAHTGSHGQRAVKRVCVCVWWYSRTHVLELWEHVQSISRPDIVQTKSVIAVLWYLSVCLHMSAWAVLVFSFFSITIWSLWRNMFKMTYFCIEWDVTADVPLMHSLMPSVLWRCWLGGRKGIWPVKNWVVGCWHGYLPGVRCRLASGSADATATHCLLLQ